LVVVVVVVVVVVDFHFIISQSFPASNSMFQMQMWLISRSRMAP
jgi:hypothetical protein